MPGQQKRRQATQRCPWKGMPDKSWALLKDAIQRCFGHTVYADYDREKLTRCWRSLGESLGACAADVCAYTCQRHPTFSQEVQEKLVV